MDFRFVLVAVHHPYPEQNNRPAHAGSGGNGFSQDKKGNHNSHQQFNIEEGAGLGCGQCFQSVIPGFGVRLTAVPDGM